MSATGIRRSKLLLRASINGQMVVVGPPEEGKRFWYWINLWTAYHCRASYVLVQMVKVFEFLQVLIDLETGGFDEVSAKERGADHWMGQAKSLMQAC